MTTSMRSILLFPLLFVLRIHGQSLFDIHDLDWSTRPNDNFFMFVNGHWINRTTIPPSQTEWGGLLTMRYENTYKLKRILDDLIRNEGDSSSYSRHSKERKLTDFYLAGLDEQAIERAGLGPLKETLIELQHIKTSQELIIFLLQWYKRMNQGLLFDFDVIADDHNSSIYMVNWKQTGIHLPERDYYFRNDLISKNIRLNYIYYINRLLTLSNEVLNQTTTLTDAEDVFSLETQLAVSHHTPYELRDAESNYNKYDLVQLDRLMPNLRWHRILSTLTIENQTVLIGQPDYYQLLNRLLVSQSLTIWKNKIRFTLLHEMSRYLSRDFVQARFEMFDQLIAGQHEDKTRWMKVIEEINQSLGDSLGQLFVARHFSTQSKEHLIDLVQNLMHVYHERINRIDWISNSTKEAALKKLKAINIKIGYPSKWQTYESVDTNRSSYFQCVASVRQYEYEKKMKDLRKKVDRDEWMIPAQIVNAFYYPLYNEIIFPAAILQEPFFSFHADDALNYGAIGYAIGHELTHAFDDQGRKYDEQGNLRLWWTEQDINTFNSRTEMLVRQYDDYQIFNTNINGRLTLGENIADLGGLEIAYEAFLHTKQAREDIRIDDFTPKERFFLAFARTWRTKLTNGRMLSFIKEEPHAPMILRVNGPLSNMMGFYQTFNVSKGDAMFREEEDRVLIW